VLVTSPGRQAENGRRARRAAGRGDRRADARADAQEEGALAWRGAIAAAREAPGDGRRLRRRRRLAQIAVGSPTEGPAWVRSVDIGSLRLTRRAFRADPRRRGPRRAARAIAEAFEDLAPPLPLGALAVGGTARALRRVAGDVLGPDELAAALRELRRSTSRQVAKTYRLDRQRARTITAGALILARSSAGSTFHSRVGRGGLREGAALQLLDATVAATA
jgi:exopolyphosphatase/pppGpp-phosphohydrolase